MKVVLFLYPLVYSVSGTQCPLVPRMECRSVHKPVFTTRTENQCLVVTEQDCGEPTLEQDCKLRRAEDCHTVPKTVCSTLEQPDVSEEGVREEVVGKGEEELERSEKNCRVIQEEQCRLQQRTECKKVKMLVPYTVEEKICEDVTERTCRTETETVCTIRESRECGTEMIRQTHKILDQECLNVQNPLSVSTVCRTVERERVLMVPIQSCRTVPVENCVQVPRTVCSAAPTQVCRMVAIRRSREETVDHCGAVEAKVCVQVRSRVCRDGGAPGSYKDAKEENDGETNLEDDDETALEDNDETILDDEDSTDEEDACRTEYQEICKPGTVEKEVCEEKEVPNCQEKEKEVCSTVQVTGTEYTQQIECIQNYVRSC